jgi:hypothetical protein
MGIPISKALAERSIRRVVGLDPTDHPAVDLDGEIQRDALQHPPSARIGLDAHRASA